jgi:hypothetical protein
LNLFEQPESKELCQIQNHLNLKKKINSITIDPLINEGLNLLKNLIGEDIQQQSLLSNSQYASNQIQIKLNQLDIEWQLFHLRLKNTQKIISCMFHQKADKVNKKKFIYYY